MSQSERERALHRANCLASDLDVVHAIKVDHGKAYINMDLLADALAALDTPQEPATAAPPDVPQTKEQRELEFNKIVAAPRTHTNPSQRLPAVIYGRYLAGESVAHLAWDYGIPEEQVQWGIRIGHMLAAAPRPALSPDAHDEPTRKALILAKDELRETMLAHGLCGRLQAALEAVEAALAPAPREGA